MSGRVIHTILNLKDQTSSKLVQVSKQVRETGGEMQKTAKKTERFANTFANTTKRVVAGSAKIVAVGAAIAGAFLFKGAISTYAEFEQSMANVKALSQATGDTFEQLKNAALEAGKTTSKTATEAADALGYMALAGWSAEDSMKGLMPILRLSEVGQADLARTSDLVTDSMSAMGVSVENLQGYLDRVAQVSRKSNTDITQMMEAYNGVGGTLRNLNIPLEESGALLGMLANRSIKGSEAGTKLSSLMVNLTTGAGQAGKALNSIGLSAFDAQGRFKGVTAVLTELNEATKNLSQQQREKLFAQIGGKTQVDTLNALMGGLNTVTSEGISEFESLKKAIAESDGALAEMADTINGTMSGAWKRLKSAADDFKIRTMGTIAPYITKQIDTLAVRITSTTDRLIPKLTAIIETIKGPIKKVTEFWKANWDIFAGIAVAAAAFAVVNKSARAFFATIRAVKSAVALLSGTLTLTPLAAVALGIAAAAAGFVILYRRSEAFRETVQKTAGKLREFAGYISAQALPKLKAFGSWIRQNIIPALLDLKNMLTAIWHHILVPLGSFLAATFGPVVKSVAAESLLAAFDAIGRIGNKLAAGIAFLRKIMQTATMLIQNAKAAWINFKAAVIGVCDRTRAAVDAALEPILNKIQWLKEKLQQFADWFRGGWLKGPEPVSVRTNYENVISIRERTQGAGQNIGSGRANDESSGQRIKTAATRIRSAGQRIKENALGTSYYSGGPTRIHERGGEIVQLPGGTKIIPHDVSVKAAGGNNVTVYVTIQGNVIGNREYLEEVGQYVGKRVVEALDRVG